MGWMDMARVAVIAAGMFYASYEDWVRREVDDGVWIVCGAIGGALTALDLASRWSLSLLTASAISIAISSGLAITLYYLGLYGGADAKAVMTISLGLPIYHAPRILHPFTGLASLSNGLLLSLGLLVAFFFWNLQELARGRRIFEGLEHEGAVRKLMAMFLGVRVRNARRKGFWFPLEEERDGRRFFKFGLFELELREVEWDDCWLTPGIPLLIFITGGFLVYILAGDLLRFIIDALAPI